MPNNILTPQIVANEALMVLLSNLTMANLVHRDYSDEFVKVGDTILYAKYSGTDVKVDGTEYKILSIKDALAIIE